MVFLCVFLWFWVVIQGSSRFLVFLGGSCGFGWVFGSSCWFLLVVGSSWWLLVVICGVCVKYGTISGKAAGVVWKYLP